MTRLIQKIIKISSQRAAIFLNQKQKLIQIQKFAEIGKISSGLIHDLISPITTLGLQIEILDEKTIRKPEFIKSIKESIINVDRYSKLVKYYISGDETKKMVDLGQTIENAIKLISYNAIKKNIQIQFLRKEKIKIFVKPIIIYQIVISLVSNAIESFGEKDKPRKIIVKLNKIKKQIILSVKDFGVGIKNTKIIFKTFYTTKKNSGGTGIGLSTVKNIVENELGGKIEVKSKAYYGSEFKILFNYQE